MSDSVLNTRIIPATNGEPDKLPKSASRISIGESYDFSALFIPAGLTNSIDNFTYSFEVKKYPGDTATISGALSTLSNGYITGALTQAQTALLSVGLWQLIISATDGAELQHQVQRIEVKEVW